MLQILVFLFINLVKRVNTLILQDSCNDLQFEMEGVLIKSWHVQIARQLL
jgi:hypothetical protein